MFFTNVTNGVTTLTKLNSANGNNVQPTFNPDGTSSPARISTQRVGHHHLADGPAEGVRADERRHDRSTKTISGLTITE